MKQNSSMRFSVISLLSACALFTACDEGTTINIHPDNESCKNACSENVCEGTTLKKCIDTDNDGCTEIVTQKCEACSDGKCINGTACEDECSDDDTPRCAGQNSIKICQSNDGCMEWVIEACPEGTECDSDECKNVENTCEEECPDGSECKDGECKPIENTCTNACTGGTECDGKSTLKTCKKNSKGCMEWVSESCPSGTECSNGACKTPDPVCTDACTSGTACDGKSALKTCKKNSKGCMEWVSESCPSGTECSSGACKTVQVTCKYTSAEDPGLKPLPAESKAGAYETKSTTTNIGTFNDEFLYNSTGEIKIGIRPDWGGSIVYFGMKANGTNTIDGVDTGREVQVAVYDGKRLRQGCAASATNCSSAASGCGNTMNYMGWNPVQGGDQCLHGSGYNTLTKKNGVLQVTTTPIHWNAHWTYTSCDWVNSSVSCPGRPALKSNVDLTQTIRFIDPNIAEIEYSLVSHDAETHSYGGNEFPTMYVGNSLHNTPDLYRLLTLDKNGNPIQISINESANDGLYVKSFTAAVPWVTFQSADTSNGQVYGAYGVGLYYENGKKDFQAWQNRTAHVNNVRSPFSLTLEKDKAVNARAYLILGGYNTIKDKATWLTTHLKPFGRLDNPAAKSNNTAEVSGSSITVNGWALDNTGISSVVAKIDESTETKLTYGSSRPDVNTAWPGYPSGNNVGYSGTVDISGLNKSCSHLIEIIATDKDNNKRTIARRLITIK